MNHYELQNMIGRVRKIALDKASKEKDERITELIVIGISVLGELFVDIKRIADAAERAKELYDR